MGHETPYWFGETHVDFANGAFGGAPYRATKRCTGWGGRIWTVPLRPSVELFIGSRQRCAGWGRRM
eukprot:8036698-Pyramimonas_sp.AAC.1